jgi:hypothetical protein
MATGEDGLCYYDDYQQGRPSLESGDSSSGNDLSAIGFYHQKLTKELQNFAIECITKTE